MRNALLVLGVLALLVGLGPRPMHAGEEAGGTRVPVLPKGKDLSTNPGFETGSGDAPAAWRVHQEDGAMQVAWGDHGIDGTKGMLFTAPEGAPESLGPANVSQRVRNLPKDATLELTVWIRLSAFEGSCVVWGRCDGARGMERREGGYDNSILAGYAPQGTTIWSPVTIRLTTGSETREVVWGVLVSGKGRLQIDEAHALVREIQSYDAPPERTPPASATRPATGAGIYRAEGRYRVVARAGPAEVHVRFPLPLLWRDQIPLDLHIASEPEGHVQSVTLTRRESGHWIADVVLTGLVKGEEVRFAWTGHVLALPHEPTPIPKDIELPLADVPPEIRPWLVSTWCCASDDEAVATVAAEIREAGTSADVVVPATLRRMRTVFGAAQGHVDALTATEALTKRGSCTSCANLGAALLRAHGIPARVIAGYPTWSGPLQTHYVVEYWLPDGGWRLLESTKCLDDRPSWEQIEVGLVLPGDEAQERAGARRGAAPGVPWLTLTEYPDTTRDILPQVYLTGDTARRGCDHQAVPVARVKGSRAEWNEVRTLLTKRWQTLIAAAAEDPTRLAAMAPARDLEEDVDSIHDLLEAYGID